MIRKMSVFIITLFFALSGQYSAQESTGTRIKDVESFYPKSVLWYSETSDIKEIRGLLQDGEKDLAVEKARDYVSRLKNISGNDGKQLRYFAYNALCAALTSKGDIKEAIESCSRAIEINPSYWTALNTRGTAYYLSGQHKLALNDYKKALEMVKGLESQTELIQHNIGLVEKKLNNSK